MAQKKHSNQIIPLVQAIFIRFKSLHLRQRKTRRNAGFSFVHAGFQAFCALRLLPYFCAFLRFKGTEKAQENVGKCPLPGGGGIAAFSP